LFFFVGFVGFVGFFIGKFKGGDLGMFIVAMQTVEEFRGISIQPTEMDVALSIYVSELKDAFAVCTSTAALDRLVSFWPCWVL
jgi:hypothetical protein